MAKRIVSIPTLAGGRPTVEGTRLTCADVAANIEGLGLRRFCENSGLDRADVLASLDYCAEQRCAGQVRAYCHSCQRQPDEPGGAPVWTVAAKLRGEIR
jgi:uncharacterized protein (DUF433 family)